MGKSQKFSKREEPRMCRGLKKKLEHADSMFASHLPGKKQPKPVGLKSNWRKKLIENYG